MLYIHAYIHSCVPVSHLRPCATGPSVDPDERAVCFDVIRMQRAPLLKGTATSLEIACPQGHAGLLLDCFFGIKDCSKLPYFDGDSAPSILEVESHQCALLAILSCAVLRCSCSISRLNIHFHLLHEVCAITRHRRPPHSHPVHQRISSITAPQHNNSTARRHCELVVGAAPPPCDPENLILPHGALQQHMARPAECQLPRRCRPHCHLEQRIQMCERGCQQYRE